MKSKEQHDNKQIEQTNEKHNGTSAASAFVYVDFDDTFAWTSQCLKLKHKNSLRYGFDRHSFIIRVISTIFVFWIQTVQCSIGSAELTELVHTNICLISICIKLCNFAWNIHNTFIHLSCLGERKPFIFDLYTQIKSNRSHSLWTDCFARKMMMIFPNFDETNFERFLFFGVKHFQDWAENSKQTYKQQIAIYIQNERHCLQYSLRNGIRKVISFYGILLHLTNYLFPKRRKCRWCTRIVITVFLISV